MEHAKLTALILSDLYLLSVAFQTSCPGIHIVKRTFSSDFYMS